MSAVPLKPDVAGVATDGPDRLQCGRYLEFEVRPRPTATAAYAQEETMRSYRPREHDKPWVVGRSGPRLIVELDIVLASECTGGSTSGDHHGDRSCEVLQQAGADTATRSGPDQPFEVVTLPQIEPTLSVDAVPNGRASI